MSNKRLLTEPLRRRLLHPLTKVFQAVVQKYVVYVTAMRKKGSLRKFEKDKTPI